MSAKLRLHSTVLAAVLTVGLALGHAPMARAHVTASEASSALSLLPVAVSVAAPVLLVAGAGAFTVVSVAASAEGSVWVLERASDGARASVRFAGHASAAVGAAGGTGPFGRSDLDVDGFQQGQGAHYGWVLRSLLFGRGDAYLARIADFGRNALHTASCVSM